MKTKGNANSPIGMTQRLASDAARDEGTDARVEIFLIYTLVGSLRGHGREGGMGGKCTLEYIYVCMYVWGDISIQSIFVTH